jgi:hypothetical protein
MEEARMGEERGRWREVCAIVRCVVECVEGKGTGEVNWVKMG